MGPCLSLHTQIAIVAGREGCHAQGLLEIDWFITLDWGSLPPLLKDAGLAASFLGQVSFVSYPI